MEKTKNFLSDSTEFITKNKTNLFVSIVVLLLILVWIFSLGFISWNNEHRDFKRFSPRMEIQKWKFQREIPRFQWKEQWKNQELGCPYNQQNQNNSNIACKNGSRCPMINQDQKVPTQNNINQKETVTQTGEQESSFFNNMKNRMNNIIK